LGGDEIEDGDYAAEGGYFYFAESSTILISSPNLSILQPQFGHVHPPHIN